MLGNLWLVDHLLMGKVGDGARDLEDTVVGAGAHPHRVKGAAQKLLCLFGGRAVSSKTSGRDAGVAGDGGARKALILNLSGSFDLVADCAELSSWLSPVREENSSGATST